MPLCGFSISLKYPHSQPLVDLSAVGEKKKREKEEKEEGRKDEKGMCEGKIENEFRG